MLKTMIKVALLLLSVLGVFAPAWAQGTSSAVLTIVGMESGNATGNLTITVNGETQIVPFGQFSTAASIASGFGAYFSQYPGTTGPPLCTLGICARSDGAKVVFQLEGPSVFQAVTWSTTSGSPFSVDTLQWPGTGTQAPLSMTLACAPSPVVSGGSTTCTASLPTGTAGSVNFTIDGNTWQSGVAIASNGNAVATGGLGGAALGEHLIEAAYLSAGGVTSSAFANVEVDPNTGPPTGVYSYYIQTQGGQSGYAANGNIVSYTDSINGIWQNITYDSVNRLTSAQQGPPGSSTPTLYDCWGYDSFGNRTIQASETNHAPSAGCQPDSSSDSYFASLLSFTAANAITGGGTPNTNQVAGGATENQSGAVQAWPPIPSPNQMYDAAGNYIYDAVSNNQYLYDADGRLCAAHTAGGMTGYIYDAGGNRVAKGVLSTMSCDSTLVVNGQPNFSVTTLYMLGPNGETMTEVDGGNWARTHVSAGGEEIATYDANGIHFQIHDWLGTRRVQTNAIGVPEASFASQPFGDCLGLVTCPDPVGDASDQHFTGKERDQESGLDYFGARYYSSSMGRFSSPDPSGLYYADQANPQSLNLYSYAQNNPLRNTDPTGMYCDYSDHDDPDSGRDASQFDFHSNTGECGQNGGQWVDDAYTQNGTDVDGRPDEAVTTTTTTSRPTGFPVGQPAGFDMISLLPRYSLQFNQQVQVGGLRPVTGRFPAPPYAPPPPPPMSPGMILLSCQAAMYLNDGGGNPGGIVIQDASNDTAPTVQSDTGANHGTVFPVPSFPKGQASTTEPGGGDGPAGALHIAFGAGNCNTAVGAIKQ